MAVSGKSGYVTYGVTSLCVERWSISNSTPAVDTTNTCTAGFQDNVAGLYSASITASGPVLSAGTTLPSVGDIVTFELGYVNNVPANVAIATIGGIVQSVRNSLAVDGRYEYELTAQSVPV